ncbi:MAG: hypothetical protein AB8B97_27690, partial [Granulosicoccus sp.]
MTDRAWHNRQALRCLENAQLEQPRIISGMINLKSERCACIRITSVLVGHAGNSVTDMSFPPSSEQGRKATRIGYTGSFSNAGLAAMGTKCDD